MSECFVGLGNGKIRVFEIIPAGLPPLKIARPALTRVGVRDFEAALAFISLRRKYPQAIRARYTFLHGVTTLWHSL